MARDSRDGETFGSLALPTFAFLYEDGFEATEITDTGLWLESKDVTVRVIFEFRDPSIITFIGPKIPSRDRSGWAPSFDLETLLAAAGVRERQKPPRLPKELRSGAIAPGSAAAILQEIQRQADLMRRYCGRYFAGDFSNVSELIRTQEERAKRLMPWLED